MEELKSKKRVRWKVKLSVGQRKKGKQFIHSKSNLCKGTQYCKRKLTDDACEIIQKVQILDCNETSVETLNQVGFNDVDINAEENDECQQNKFGTQTFSFHVSSDYSKRGKCMSGNNINSSSSDDKSDCEEDQNDVFSFYYNKICKEDLLKPLIQKLCEKGMMKDFVNLLQVLSDGTLEVENIPFILCLERAKLCKCTTNTLMRFHPKSKAFWCVAYRTWHGKGLLLMSGSKNRGQVRNN